MEGGGSKRTKRRKKHGRVESMSDEGRREKQHARGLAQERIPLGQTVALNAEAQAPEQGP